MSLSWFLPGHLEAPKAELGASCPAPTLEPLLPSPWPYHQPAAPGSLLWVPPTYSRALESLLTQLEPVRKGPGPPARPPTAQEVCYRRAQQAQRESANWLQATPRPAEKPSSVHISAPGEKRRIAHVPNPRLAAGESQCGSTVTALAVVALGSAWLGLRVLVCKMVSSPRLLAGGWSKPGAVPSSPGLLWALVLAGGGWLWRV